MTTEALIIRINNNVGEADRIVTALTLEAGVIRASVRGARGIKSRLSASTGLLSYSRLSLRQGRDIYIIEDAEPLRIFSRLSEDVCRLSMAQYLCELAGVLAPRDGHDSESAADFLRLMLRALHLISPPDRDTAPRDVKIVKSVVELRMLSHAGFMPDLHSCAMCAQLPADAGIRLLPGDGRIICGNCARELSGTVEVTPSVLAAMRHIISAPAKRSFSFSVSEQSAGHLANVTEVYTLAQLGRGFKTLDVYHSL